MPPRRSSRLKKQTPIPAPSYAKLLSGKENVPVIASPHQSPPPKPHKPPQADIFDGLDDIAEVKLPPKERQEEEDFSEIQPDFAKLNARAPKPLPEEDFSEIQPDLTKLIRPKRISQPQRDETMVTPSVLPIRTPSPLKPGGRPPLRPLQPSSSPSDAARALEKPHQPTKTYGKRRARGAAVPSMRDLGMLKTPSERGSPSNNSESEDSEIEEEQDQDGELQTFLKRQRELWAEVDQIELEEALD